MLVLFCIAVILAHIWLQNQTKVNLEPAGWALSYLSVLVAFIFLIRWMIL